MTNFNYGDIIEYIDETYDPNFDEARNWAYAHNTTFEELVDRRKEHTEKEKYTELENEEITVPAKTHEEVVPAELDDEGKVITKEHKVTIVDEPEHTELVPKEVEKTVKVKKLYRYFQIGQEYVPTEDELKAQMLGIRDLYFSEYVDWYQSKPLLWEELSAEEKQDISDYRQYLKGYNDTPNWWNAEPLNYDDWLKAK